MALPTTRYARAGDIEVGYQVIGDGPIDLVFIWGLASNIDVMWEEPSFAALLRRLAEFSRLILFDRRGCGVSDRGGATETPTLEERRDDVLAVLDAVGVSRASLLGVSEGGSLAALFAATHPERTAKLVLYGAIARFLRDADHPVGLVDRDEARAFEALIAPTWGERNERAVALWAPTLADDDRFIEWWARFWRQSLSRRLVKPLMRALAAYDLVDVYPAVRVPTLVLHRRHDRLIPAAHGRWIAEQVPDARLVELDGVDHLPFVGDAGSVAAEIERFLVGPRALAPRDRRLLAVAAVRVGRSARLAHLDEQAWQGSVAMFDRELAHHLDRAGGREVRTSGDGHLVVFDGPARAIRCSVGLVDAAARLGLSAQVGVHCGECEVSGEDVLGLPVHIATEMALSAVPGQVLVSSTVRDLVAGSGLRFDDGRELQLDGLAGTRSAFAVQRDAGAVDTERRRDDVLINAIRFEGEYWTLAYAGQVVMLRDSKGLHDLARLLAAPQQELHALVLMAEAVAADELVSGREASEAGLAVGAAGGDPIVDVSARTAYQRRIAELEEELIEADRHGDPDAVARLRSERDLVVDEIAAAYGLGGRPRRTPDHVERARKAVTRRIRTALERIAEVHPALGDHLDVSVQTGTYCCYRPDREVVWDVEPA